MVFKPSTKKELQDAVNLWCDNKEEAVEKYGVINTWDTSLITYMSHLFEDKKDFNGDISNWDISNVTNMFCIFYYCSNFNQPLNNWNMSNVLLQYSHFLIYPRKRINRE